MAERTPGRNETRAVHAMLRLLRAEGPALRPRNGRRWAVQAGHAGGGSPWPAIMNARSAMAVSRWTLSWDWRRTRTMLCRIRRPCRRRLTMAGPTALQQDPNTEDVYGRTALHFGGADGVLGRLCGGTRSPTLQLPAGKELGVDVLKANWSNGRSPATTRGEGAAKGRGHLAWQRRAGTTWRRKSA
jgi:hypothetical protein